jgi:hypothetical protein
MGVHFIMLARKPPIGLVVFLIYLCVLLQVSVHNIRLPKQCTVGDVIHELKGKVFLLPGCGVVHLSVNLTSLGFYASLEVVLLKGVLLGSGLIYRLNYLVQMRS